jgi:putative transposase
VIGAATLELAGLVGPAAACEATGMARATFYRRHRPPAAPAGPARPAGPPRPRGGPGSQPRALSAVERGGVLAVLHSERFCDKSVEEVYHTLLDEGVYLCSASTMYRLLRELGETGERRRQATHPAKVKPELVADAPNQVWSWDITKLKGPAKWVYYHLYVAIDIYSRYVTAWMVAPRESDKLAEAMFAGAIRAQRIRPGQLTVHADRGSAMTSKTLAQLLADLDVTRSHSRPHVSNDNPYSESNFKTLKYRPDFPARFGSIDDARLFCAEFVDWYNHEHRHSGIGYHTPADIHTGAAATTRERRAQTLAAAYRDHPERFVRQPPTPPELPGQAWINQPTQHDTR